MKTKILTIVFWLSLISLFSVPFLRGQSEVKTINLWITIYDHVGISDDAGYSKCSDITSIGFQEPSQTETENYAIVKVSDYKIEELNKWREPYVDPKDPTKLIAERLYKVDLEGLGIKDVGYYKEPFKFEEFAKFITIKNSDDIAKYVENQKEYISNEIAITIDNLKAKPTNAKLQSYKIKLEAKMDSLNRSAGVISE